MRPSAWRSCSSSATRSRGLGERDAARAVLAEAHAVATELGDERLIAWATLVTGQRSLWGEASHEQLLREIDDVVPVLAQAGDHEALAIAELGRFHAFDRARLPDPEERLSIALEHARKAGARHIEDNVVSWICITLPRGTVPVDAAIARVEGIAEASSSAYVHASALGALGLLRAQKGEFEEARALVTRGSAGAGGAGPPADGGRAFDRGRRGRGDGGRRDGRRACVQRRVRRVERAP